MCVASTNIGAVMFYGLLAVVGVLFLLLVVGEMDYQIDRLQIPSIFKKILSLFGVFILLTGIYYGLTYLGL